MVQNKITTIIGQKGHGKTKLTEALALLNDRPTIIVDPRFQYEENSRRVMLESVGAFRVWINNRTNFNAFYTYKLELVVNAFDDTFEELAQIVYKMQMITFVIDEVDMFAPVHLNNKTFMYKLIHYGRHNQIDIISTSRRPANISRNLTSQTDTFYFSKLREPSDKKYIKDSIGEEYVKTVALLEQFSFLCVTEQQTKVVKTTKRMAQLLG
jgi:hypothetical protein